MSEFNPVAYEISTKKVLRFLLDRLRPGFTDTERVILIEARIAGLDEVREFCRHFDLACSADFTTIFESKIARNVDTVILQTYINEALGGYTPFDKRKMSIKEVIAYINGGGPWIIK
jgi:hypothetical protein